MTHNYWISIGRNRGDSPASVDIWRSFQDSIGAIVCEEGGNVITDVSGVSSWNGATEETYLVLAQLDESAVDTVRDRLAELARAHKQEAIGFVGGPGTDTYISA